MAQSQNSAAELFASNAEAATELVVTPVAQLLLRSRPCSTLGAGIPPALRPTPFRSRDHVPRVFLPFYIQHELNFQLFCNLLSQKSRDSTSTAQDHCIFVATYRSFHW